MRATGPLPEGTHTHPHPGLQRPPTPPRVNTSPARALAKLGSNISALNSHNKLMWPPTASAFHSETEAAWPGIQLGGRAASGAGSQDSGLEPAGLGRACVYVGWGSLSSVALLQPVSNPPGLPRAATITPFAWLTIQILGVGRTTVCGPTATVGVIGPRAGALPSSRSVPSSLVPGSFLVLFFKYFY